MPLVKSPSKKAFQKNVATETKALEKRGVSKQKAVKQAVAIAYATKRKASGKKSSMSRKKNKSK